jgi:antitoxin VapB
VNAGAQKEYAMALYIRDAEVDALAIRVQRAMRAKTKTDAVRLALQHELERRMDVASIDEKLAEAIALANAMGPGDPAFDQKKFMDEMWGGI